MSVSGAGRAVLIRRAVEGDFGDVRELLREYGEHLAANARGAAAICIVDYGRELAGLPGAYREPSGVILLAVVDGVPAGCLAFRPIATGAEARACEMKRLWVRPAYRGLGAGRSLIEAGIVWAREMGYAAMYLDTVRTEMVEANALYQRFGFAATGRYNDNPVADVEFFRLRL